MGRRELPCPVAIPPYSCGKGIQSIGLILRVCRIFRVDNYSGNGSDQTVQKSAEGVEIHVVGKFLCETKQLLPTVSRQQILLDKKCLEKSKFFLSNFGRKDSRNNHFPEFAPRFVSDWVGLREHNRRRRKADVEDCASEDRPKMP